MTFALNHTHGTALQAWCESVRGEKAMSIDASLRAPVAIFGYQPELSNKTKPHSGEMGT